MDNKPQIVNSGILRLDASYQSWLLSLKTRLQQHQIKAAVRVNSYMLEFYWELGRDIVAMKPEERWGTGVINQLSLDLKALFPGQKGFSTSNIWYIKK